MKSSFHLYVFIFKRKLDDMEIVYDNITLSYIIEL